MKHYIRLSVIFPIVIACASLLIVGPLLGDSKSAQKLSTSSIQIAHGSR